MRREGGKEEDSLSAARFQRIHLLKSVHLLLPSLPPSLSPTTVAPPVWRNVWPSFSVGRSRLKTLVSTGRYEPPERRGREGGRKEQSENTKQSLIRFSLPLLNQLLGPDVADEDYVAWQCDQDAYAYSGTFLSSLFPYLPHFEAACCHPRTRSTSIALLTIPPSLPPSLPQAKNAPPNPSSSPTRTGKPPAWKTSCGSSPPAVPSRT